MVVNMHRPIYTSSTAGVSPPSVLRVAEDLQQALEPVFALYQVCVLVQIILARDSMNTLACEEAQCCIFA